jgi:ribosome assembly protein 1
MEGVAFALERVDWKETSAEEVPGHDQYGPLCGQVMSATKDACRQAFLQSGPRLVEALYLCEVMVSQDMLGKVYGVLSKRRAKVCLCTTASFPLSAAM